MSFFSKIFRRFTGQSEEDKNQEKQKQAAVKTAIKNDVVIDENYIEALEENLIRSDLGVKIALDFTAEITKKYEKGEIKTEAEIELALQDFLLRAFKGLDEKEIEYRIEEDKLNILLVVGVNGVGKTTSIGKLAKKFKDEKKNVLIAAGDTFRAAAEEQLNIWAQRAACDICQLEDGAKSSTVVYKSLEMAKEKKSQLLIIDTAGRLQNKKNLMDELTKLRQVIEKNLEKDSFRLETLLVLDATTGSNALSQAENFNEATKLDGIILSKFDGSARAGMIFSLAHNFKLPVKFVGTGEGLDDISRFDIKDFSKKYFQ